MTTVPSPLQQPAEEFERRYKWGLLPTLSFISLMVLLLVVAIATLVVKPRHPYGLPDDADARAAAAALAGRVSSGAQELRWRAAVLGGEPAAGSPNATMRALVLTARPALESARRRHPGDPRALAALAALDVVNHDYVRAAGRYRGAYERAPHYAEARLGAGVALALEAGRTAGPWQARALRLQAVAQFAMVDSTEAEYPMALYNRARVLAETGRSAEAAFWANRYLAREPDGWWANALREALGRR